MNKLMKNMKDKLAGKKNVNSVLKALFLGVSMLSAFLIVVLLGMYGYQDTRKSNHSTKQALDQTNEQVKDVTRVVETMQSSADEMESSIMTLDTTLDAMQGSLEAIKEAVPEDADIAGKMEQIDRLNETISLVKQELGQVSDVIDSLESFAGDTQESLIGVDAYTNAVNENLLSIRDRITEITTEMGGIQEDIIVRKKTDSELSAAIDAVEKDFDHIYEGISTNINTIYADMGRVNTSISDLQAGLVKADSNISEMKNEFEKQTTDILADISDIGGNVSGIEGSVADMKGNVTDIEKKVSAMQGEITTASGKVTDILNTDLPAMRADVDSVKGDLSSLSGRLEEYRSALEGNMNAVTENLAGNMAGLQEAVNALAASDTGLQESINSLASNDSGLQGAIDALATRVTECFQSVSDGKTLLASAITDKGVATSADADFEVMAANIQAIQTAPKTARTGSVFYKTDWGANYYKINLNLPEAGTYDITVDASLLWNTGAGMAWADYHTMTIDGFSGASRRLTVDGPKTIQVIGRSDYSGLVIVYVKYTEVE